jgi:hypothetical protein
VLSAILRGERPLADVPPRVLADLERLGVALDGVLRATHAERADYASVADGFDPSPGATGLGLQYAAALVAVRIRAAVATGDAIRAAAARAQLRNVGCRTSIPSILCLPANPSSSGCQCDTAGSPNCQQRKIGSSSCRA